MKTPRLPFGSLLLTAGLVFALAGCRSNTIEHTAQAPTGADTSNSVAPTASVSSAPTTATAPTTPTAPSEPEAIASPPPAIPPAPVANTTPTPEPAVAPPSTNAPVARLAPQMPELSPAVREVVEMAHSQVGDAVLLEFARGSTVPFDADAEDLVYLKDIGVPDDVVAAMLRRTAELREQGVTAATSTDVPAEPPPSEAGATVTEPATVTTMAASAPAPLVYSQPVTAVPSAEPALASVEAPPPTSNYFYSTLAPYGSWLYIEPYGWCWQPTVAVTVAEWRPYAHGGRWLYTTSGWYWQSHYSWGWAPFHYGNWYASPACGWVWVPGSVWAPAWVSWRYTSAYCGWAPLPPGAGWTAGIGLTYYGSGVSVGFSFGLSSSCYTFVPWNYCWYPSPYRYCAAPAQVVHVYNNSTVINNYYTDNNSKTVINNGVPPEQMPSVARRNLRRLDIKDVQAGQRSPVRPEQTSLDGTKIAAYRPKVPADLKASPTRADAAPDRSPRDPNRNASASRSGVGTVPTALGGAPGNSFATPLRSGSPPARTAPTPSGSRTGPATAAPSSASTGRSSPTRTTPGLASPSPSSRSDGPVRSGSTRAAPARSSGPTFQPVPRRTEPAAAPSRVAPSTINRAERAPTSTDRRLPGATPFRSGAPTRTGVTRGDPVKPGATSVPTRSAGFGAPTAPSAVPSRSTMAPPPTAFPNRAPMRSGSSGAVAPYSGPAPSRSLAPGAAGPSVGRSTPPTASPGLPSAVAVGRGSAMSVPTAPTTVPGAGAAPPSATPRGGSRAANPAPTRAGSAPSRTPQVQ